MSVQAPWALGFSSLAVVLGGGLGLLAFLNHRLVAVTVRGASMQPTFQDGDRVLVDRRARPCVGQVVVVEQPTPDGHWPSPHLPASGRTWLAGRRWMIKRVAAAPGDPVPPLPALCAVAGGRVPPNRLVLLGDNPSVSIDSRQLGYFPMERTLGTVRRRLSRRMPERQVGIGSTPGR